MKIHSLQELFHHDLKDAYSAEQQILVALPEMIAQATHDELKTALEDHRQETVGHVERLEEIAKKLDTSLAGHECQGIKGIITEAKMGMKEVLDANTKDAAIIAMAQRVEHYEMAVYGTARQYAKQLELGEVGDLLQDTLDEEGAADKKLGGIATGGWFATGVNEEAIA